MPEVFYLQRGKKKYAYTSTSIYWPGGKYPKTVNRYSAFSTKKQEK